MTAMREHLKAFYLEYVNAFITVQAMSDYKQMTEEDTLACINMGRAIHEDDVARTTTVHARLGEMVKIPQGLVVLKIEQEKQDDALLSALAPDTPPPQVYGYVAFYNGKRHELYAGSSLSAFEAAVAYFNPPKSKRHMVSVVLAERPDGTEVVHTAVN